jgi:predicted DsbA family dithiol-disulfide isomerase
MHHRLFAHQRALAPADLPGHAQSLGLDGAQFRECLDSGRKAAKIRKDLAEGQRAGVRGTPTFFLGVADDAGAGVKVLRVIRGAQPLAGFRTAIDAALAAQP